jgi:hypothetical protein
MLAERSGMLNGIAGQVNQRYAAFTKGDPPMRITIVLIRVFLGLLLAIFAIFSAMMGSSFLAYQNGSFFGTNGAVFLLGALIAAALGIASWKLLSTTLRLPAAA